MFQDIKHYIDFMLHVLKYGNPHDQKVKWVDIFKKLNSKKYNHLTDTANKYYIVWNKWVHDHPTHNWDIDTFLAYHAERTTDKLVEELWSLAAQIDRKKKHNWAY